MILRKLDLFYCCRLDVPRPYLLPFLFQTVKFRKNINYTGDCIVENSGINKVLRQNCIPSKISTRPSFDLLLLFFIYLDKGVDYFFSLKHDIIITATVDGNNEVCKTMVIVRRYVNLCVSFALGSATQSLTFFHIMILCRPWVLNSFVGFVSSSLENDE